MNHYLIYDKKKSRETKLKDERKLYLAELRATAKTKEGFTTLKNILADLDYALPISHDEGRIARQNVARKIMSDLAEADINLAVKLHVETNGWDYIKEDYNG